MTKVKICGLKEKEHVQAAVEAGADAIGFVFAPSKRKVTISEASILAKEIPSTIWKIGVFVNPTKEELEAAYHQVPLDFIQLHGNETPEFVQNCDVPTIKAFSIQKEADVEYATQFNSSYYLFDAPGTDYHGGSGLSFDWELMKGHRIPGDKIILAGGLHERNVQEAIERVKPFMVDVSSGVEIEGRKDSELIRTFVRTVKKGER